MKTYIALIMGQLMNGAADWMKIGGGKQSTQQ
jgi:hypothetical protein